MSPSPHDRQWKNRLAWAQCRSQSRPDRIEKGYDNSMRMNCHKVAEATSIILLQVVAATTCSVLNDSADY